MPLWTSCPQHKWNKSEISKQCTRFRKKKSKTKKKRKRKHWITLRNLKIKARQKKRRKDITSNYGCSTLECNDSTMNFENWTTKLILSVKLILELSSGLNRSCSTVLLNQKFGFPDWFHLKKKEKLLLNFTNFYLVWFHNPPSFVFFIVYRFQPRLLETPHCSYELKHSLCVFLVSLIPYF